MWKIITKYWHQWGSPKFFYQYSMQLLPWLFLCACIFLGIGIVWGLLFAPPDYQQGHSFRIIYIHVPAASLALSIYALMFFAAIITLVWKMKMAETVMISCAPLGAAFCCVALLTGAIWGKPTWGTWWVWDARLTSMLILFFIYVAIIALVNAMPKTVTAMKVIAILVLVGGIDLPIIKYSVDWWHTLHQPATFTVTKAPAMPAVMWLPLLFTMLGFYLLFAVAMLLVAHCHILQREAHCHWLKNWVRL